MKNVMILIVLLFFGNTLYAQDENGQFLEKYEKQVGLNATNFFLRFISFNSVLANTPDILFLYKKGNDGKKWRHGFGGRIKFRSIKDENDVHNTDGNFLLSYRFGREYYKNFSKRWGILYGWETHYRGSYSKSTSIFIIPVGQTRKNTSFSIGTGVRAIVGIQFRINDRLSLLTESSYGISLSYRKTKSIIQIEDQVEDQNESLDKIFEASTFFNAPLSIIVNYHF